MDQMPSTIRHFPIIQSLANLSYILQIKNSYEKSEKLAKEHEKFTKDVIKEKVKLDNKPFHDGIIEGFVETLQIRAKTNYDLMINRNRIFQEAYRFSNYETFLESGPQSILQLYICFRTGTIDALILVTIITSLLCFWFRTAMLFLEHPTKVLCSLVGKYELNLLFSEAAE